MTPIPPRGRPWDFLRPAFLLENIANWVRIYRLEKYKKCAHSNIKKQNFTHIYIEGDYI